MNIMNETEPDICTEKWLAEKAISSYTHSHLSPNERQLRAPALNWFSQKATFRNGPSFLMPALYMEKGPGLTPFPSMYLKFVRCLNRAVVFRTRAEVPYTYPKDATLQLAPSYSCINGTTLGSNR